MATGLLLQGGPGTETGHVLHVFICVIFLGGNCKTPPWFCTKKSNVIVYRPILHVISKNNSCNVNNCQKEIEGYEALRIDTTTRKYVLPTGNRMAFKAEAYSDF